MKKLLILFSVLLFLVCLKSFAQRVDLIFLIDGSASMSGQPFTTEKEGLASAVEDPSVIPTDGSVSVTVIQFSGGSPPDPDARVEVHPTLITSPAVAQQVASAIRNITILNNLTYFAPAFDLAVSTIMSWPQRAQRQVINLITDGNNFDQAETATAVSNAMSAGIELINVMDVGYGLDEDNMWSIANPHYPGYPDPSKRPASPSKDYGYVWLLTGWEQFGPAVKQKILTELRVVMNLHDNYAGIPYSPVTITASGGVPPYTFQVVSGIPGLNLVQITSDIAELRGVPSTPGSYNVSITITDSSTPPITTVYQGPVNVLLPPYVAVERTGGKILYVKNISRGIDGEITSTGNLFIKDTTTKVENQLTNYTGNFVIRNPFFSSDGLEIIYTSNISGTWQIYIISSQDCIGSPIQKIVCNNGYPHPYASLSPDKTNIALVQERAGKTELLIYNRNTKNYSLILSNAEITLTHLAFLDNGTIAFIGIKDGIQDIYKITVDGKDFVNLTKNISITPRYGRIITTFRDRNRISFYDDLTNLTYQLNEIIYAKQVWQGFGYAKWDVYSYNIELGTEVNLTKTPDMDEFDPCYGNIADLWRGDMFYSASLLAGYDIWLTNYEWYDWYTITNSIKTPLTGSATSTEMAGLVDFIPSTDIGVVPGKPITMQDTRIVYYGGNGIIYRSDFDGTNWYNPGTTISAGAVEKSVCCLDPTGGKFVYTVNSVPQTLAKSNHDGSGETIFSSGTPAGNEIKDACFSPDGRWVVFVKREKPGRYGLYAKMTKQDSTYPDIPLCTDINSTDVAYPSFSPDGTVLVFSIKQPGGTSDIWKLTIKTDDSTSITTGILQNLTNTPAISETSPSFSPDGKKIIFISNHPEGINQVYACDTNGTSIELVVEGKDSATGQNLDINRVLFGDVNVETSVYYIAYASTNPATGTKTIKIARFEKVDPTPGDGKNLATLYMDTGLTPASDKFDWAIKREKGTVVGQRILSRRAAKDQDFQYGIAIDVDEASLLSAYTLEEIISSDFSTSDISVSIDGGTFFNPTIFENSAEGFKTIKLAFGPGQNGGAVDHYIKVRMKAPSYTGNQAIEGRINYILNGTPTSSTISGNSSIFVSSPYLPVDVYDETGLEGSDGIIEDWDLLFTIDAWCNDRQLSGYGIRWPEDISNWDGIIHAIINIWASPAGTTGYHTGGTTTASEVSGQYQYVGPNQYRLSPSSAPVFEMYWTQGKWID